MSVVLIDALESWLAAGNLLDGYTVAKNRWTDAQEESGAEFIVIRNAGAGGNSNRLLKQIDLRVILVASPDKVVAAQNRMDEIVDYLRAASQPPTVVKYAVTNNPVGPLYMTDGRAVIEVNVRAYQEGS